MLGSVSREFRLTTVPFRYQLLILVIGVEAGFLYNPNTTDKYMEPNEHVYFIDLISCILYNDSR